MLSLQNSVLLKYVSSSCLGVRGGREGGGGSGEIDTDGRKHDKAGVCSDVNSATLLMKYKSCHGVHI